MLHSGVGTRNISASAGGAARSQRRSRRASDTGPNRPDPAAGPPRAATSAVRSLSPSVSTRSPRARVAREAGDRVLVVEHAYRDRPATETSNDPQALVVPAQDHGADIGVAAHRPILAMRRGFSRWPAAGAMRSAVRVPLSAQDAAVIAAGLGLAVLAALLAATAPALVLAALLAFAAVAAIISIRRSGPTRCLPSAPRGGRGARQVRPVPAAQRGHRGARRRRTADPGTVRLTGQVLDPPHRRAGRRDPVPGRDRFDRAGAVDARPRQAAHPGGPALRLPDLEVLRGLPDRAGQREDGAPGAQVPVGDTGVVERRGADRDSPVAAAVRGAWLDIRLHRRVRVLHERPAWHGHHRVLVGGGRRDGLLAARSLRHG